MKSETQTLNWSKLEQFIKDRNPVSVSAGLLQDWVMTAATVYENGEWLDKGAAYVSSFWATPAFKAKMKNGDIIEVIASRPETKRDVAKAEAKRKAARKEIDKFLKNRRKKTKQK